MRKTREIKCPGCDTLFQTISKTNDTYCLSNDRCHAAYDAKVNAVEAERAEIRRTRPARRPRQPLATAYGDYGQLGAFLGVYRDKTRK